MFENFNKSILKIANKNYSNQSIVSKPTFSVNGDKVTLIAHLKDVNNNYKWFSGSNLLSGKNTKEITIKLSEINGDVWYKATNSVYTELTLESNKTEYVKIFKISIDEHKVLKDLYNSTDGNNWSNKKWNDLSLPVNSTNFPGITIVNNHVTKLNFLETT